MSYDDNAAPVYEGLARLQAREGIALEGKLNARRTILEEPLDDFSSTPLTPGSSALAQGRVGAGRQPRRAPQDRVVELPGRNLASGISWSAMADTARHAESGEAMVSVIDMRTGKW